MITVQKRDQPAVRGGHQPRPPRQLQQRQNQQQIQQQQTQQQHAQKTQQQHHQQIQQQNRQQIQQQHLQQHQLQNQQQQQELPKPQRQQNEMLHQKSQQQEQQKILQQPQQQQNETVQQSTLQQQKQPHHRKQSQQWQQKKKSQQQQPQHGKKKETEPQQQGKKELEQLQQQRREQQKIKQQEQRKKRKEQKKQKQQLNKQEKQQELMQSAVQSDLAMNNVKNVEEQQQWQQTEPEQQGHAKQPTDKQQNTEQHKQQSKEQDKHQDNQPNLENNREQDKLQNQAVDKNEIREQQERNKRVELSSHMMMELGGLTHVQQSTQRRRSDGSSSSTSSPSSSLQLAECPDKSVKTTVMMCKVIQNHFISKHQSTRMYDMKMAIRRRIHSMLWTKFPGCGFYAIGSSVNGLGTCDSDLDLCLIVDKTRSLTKQYRKPEAMKILSETMKILKEEDTHNLIGLQLIEAKVPILKFTDFTSGIRCDINVNNTVGVRNTHLMRCYNRLDSRLAPLMLCVKQWAKSFHINNAYHGTLSSYSLELMVIHFLQCGCYPPVLPSLQLLTPDTFNVRRPADLLRFDDQLPHYTTTNTMNVGKLLMKFLNYYANFNYKENIMSIRLGSVLKVANDPIKHRKPFWGYIKIEEPFSFWNVAYSVYSWNQFKLIQTTFLICNEQLKRTKDLNSLSFL